MLDRDVMLLQIAATLIDSNEFLVHLLNRFNLMSWAQDDYEIKYLRVSSRVLGVVFVVVVVVDLLCFFSSPLTHIYEPNYVFSIAES